jgi:hypothetical protein
MYADLMRDVTARMVCLLLLLLLLMYDKLTKQVQNYCDMG